MGSADSGLRPEQLPRLFDQTTVYRQMGLLASGGPVSFVGGLRILAGPTPDTALVLVSLSLHNRGLTFRREGNEFVAEYRVELVFRRGTEITRQVTRDERIRVSGFRETLRTEESVIFQQYVLAAAGSYAVSVTLRDRNGPNYSRHEGSLVVPALVAPAVAAPVPLYTGAARSTLDSVPDLVTNPRGFVAYGSDSLKVLLEAYGFPPGTALVLTAADPDGREVYSDSVRLDGAGTLYSGVLSIPSARFSVGRHELRVGVVGGGVVARTSFLVAFSDFWAVSNLDDMISLLRYFAPADTLRALAALPPEERAAGWRAFWRSTDPNPATPENEALEEYFARVQIAADRFDDEGAPGWLTDRGEVYINLGEPDQIVDRRADTQMRGRTIYWVYNQHRLTLAFVDDAGFGRYRLTPQSRAEYLVVVNRLHRR